MKLLLGLSVLPALLLMMYIRSKDKIDKEPLGLLVKLFALGALSTVSAAIIEVLAQTFLIEFLSESSLAFVIIENFFVVALAEEGGKLFVLKKCTWRSPEFDYTFDAVVYSVAVSLGFATLENIVYVVSSGTVGVAVMRGILSVPGHAIDGIYMGWFYGMAKRAEAQGDGGLKKSCLIKALLVPVLIHGFYDFSLSWNDDMLVAFFVFEVVITFLAFRKVNKLSREDTKIFPDSAASFTRMYQTFNGPYQGFGYQNYQGYPNYQSFRNYQQPPNYQNYGYGPYVQNPYQRPFQNQYQNPYQNRYQSPYQGSPYGGQPQSYDRYSGGQRTSPNNRSPFADRYGRTEQHTYGNNEYYKQEQKQKNFWEE